MKRGLTYVILIVALIAAATLLVVNLTRTGPEPIRATRPVRVPVPSTRPAARPPTPSPPATAQPARPPVNSAEAATAPEPPATRPQTRPKVAKLPARPKEVLALAFPNATFGKAWLDENGPYNKYNVEMTDPTSTFTATIAENGVLIKETRLKTAADLPPAVAAAAAAAAAGGQVGPATRNVLYADDSLVNLYPPQVYWSVMVVKGDSQGWMDLSEDGTVLKPLQLTPVSKMKFGG